MKLLNAQQKKTEMPSKGKKKRQEKRKKEGRKESEK